MSAALPPVGATMPAYLIAMAENALELLPQCVQASFTEGIASSGCGMNIACLCTDNAFLTMLQGVVGTSCSATDGETTLNLAGQLCVAGDPSLNNSRQPVIIAMTATLMVLSGFAIFGRLLSRKVSGISLWMDDYLIILALISTYTLNIIAFFGVHFGYGKHIITLTLSDITNFAKTYWATQLVFACAITFTKFSILFMYLRIFPSQGFRAACTGIMIFNIAWWISLILSIIFACTPINYYWNKSIEGSCININALAYGITAANFITDVSIWLLPIPWLWNLQMKKPKKLAVMGIFLLGGLVCVAGIVRLPLLIQMNSADITWSVTEAGIWITIECNLGIVCACLPIMRPLFKKFQPFASFNSWVAKHSLGAGSSTFPLRNSNKIESRGSDSGKSYRDGGILAHGDLNATPSPCRYNNMHEMMNEPKRVPRAWLDDREWSTATVHNLRLGHSDTWSDTLAAHDVGIAV